MRKLGRNDPCHCGSGKKYKKCCLAKDEANSVTRLTATQAVPQQPTVTEYVEHHLEWPNHLHRLIARHFVNQTIGMYEDNEIFQIASLWNEYAHAANPLTKKAGVYPAALEYVLCQVFGYETTQNELAAKYDVSPGVISQRSNQLLSFMDQVSDGQEANVPKAVQTGQDARIAMERSMREISALLEEQNFESLDEANAFLEQHVMGQKFTSRRKKKLSKKEQAVELLFDAWEEPDSKKRIKLAQDALMLDPDSVDAYNILAENAATSAKEMAYYYEQGMRAGERELGAAFFEENKGHFWGFTETRPYMRAKKGYAEACAEMHNLTEAIKQYKELLELNPGDNQGVRYLLVIACQEAGEWQAAEALIREYDENTAVFNFSQVIVEYGIRPKSPKLNTLIQSAHRANPHVIPLLLGKKKLPASMPDYYGFGDRNEAVMYVHMARHLWQARPELLLLLRANVGAGK